MIFKRKICQTGLSLALVAILLLLNMVTLQAQTLEHAEEASLEPELFPEDIAGGRLVDFDIKGLSYYEEARELIQLVNELRVSLGIEPLVYNMQLADLALLRAAESSVYWDHRRPDGSYLTDTNKDIHGENIAGGISDGRLVFENWLHSPGHYQNMVNPQYKSIGVAAYGSLHGEAPRWWAQVFSASLPENTMPDRANGAAVSHRIKVNPDFLAMQVITGGQINTGLQSEDFGQHDILRLRKGDGVQLYAMVHYRLEDAYNAPGSIPAKDLIWENVNPDIVSLDPSGCMTCLSEGTAVIKVYHKDLAELKTEITIEVLPYNTLRIIAEVNAARTEELYKTAIESYAAKPHVTEYVGESSAEANKLKEKIYRFNEQVGYDSRLQHLAYEFTKQFSLFLYPDAMESLPEINQLVENLPLGQRISWHAFSDLDTPEDQTVQVPGWAKSMAAMSFISGGHEVSFLIFSDAEGDGQKLSLSEIIPEAEYIPELTGFIAYEVELFKDRNDAAIHFVDQGVITSELIFYDALNDNRISLNEAGKVIYSPRVLLKRAEVGPYPPVWPAKSSIFYEVDDPNIASFTENGDLLIKAQGSFVLSVSFVDIANREILSRASILINNNIFIPEEVEANALELQQEEATASEGESSP